jgi:hypothetical protein
MTARKTYSAAEVRQMGVPAYHPKGFWYDPVAPKSRELAFFFGHRDPKKRWRWHQAPPELPQKGSPTLLERLDLFSGQSQGRVASCLSP